MKYIIDRFEGMMAVCEDETKKMVNIPKYRLPLEAKEGDALVEEDGILRLDDAYAQEQRRKVKQLIDRLF